LDHINVAAACGQAAADGRQRTGSDTLPKFKGRYSMHL